MNKNFPLIVCILLFFISCTDNSRIEKIESEIQELKKENQKLSDSLSTVQKTFIQPFEEYQVILVLEMQTPPDSLITAYDGFIKKYPGTYWQHEAKKRKTNIENRKHYWTKEKGWVFPKTEDVIYIDDAIQSCPGC